MIPFHSKHDIEWRSNRLPMPRVHDSSVLYLSLAAFAFMLLLGPTAAAQTQQTGRLDMALDRFNDDPNLAGNRIVPETGVAKIKVDAVLLANLNGLGSCSTPVQIDFSVRGPTYATASMVPQTRTIIVDGTNSQGASKSIPVSSVLEISVNRDAPAFADGLYEVSMQARSQTSTFGSSCDLGQSRIATATYRLKNEFQPRTLVETSTLSYRSSPNDKLVIPITITNLGNGPAKTTVQVEPSSSGAFSSVNGGTPLRLASAETDNQGVVRIEATIPASWGYVNRISTLKATITSTYDGIVPGTTNQDTTVVFFTVRTQGAYVPVAGVALLGSAGLGALVAVGIAALRRAGGKPSPDAGGVADKSNEATFTTQRAISRDAPLAFAPEPNPSRVPTSKPSGPPKPSGQPGRSPEVGRPRN